jgi:hypothetical protein
MILSMRQPPVRYPNTYVWLVFLSAMDIMMTWVILWHGGREVNAIADAVLARFGLWGMVAFKFGFVVLVICICEEAGRRRDSAGKFLGRFAVVISCVPVVWAMWQLAGHG